MYKFNVIEHLLNERKVSVGNGLRIQAYTRGVCLKDQIVGSLQMLVHFIQQFASRHGVIEVWSTASPLPTDQTMLFRIQNISKQDTKILGFGNIANFRFCPNVKAFVYEQFFEFIKNSNTLSVIKNAMNCDTNDCRISVNVLNETDHEPAWNEYVTSDPEEAMYAIASNIEEASITNVYIQTNNGKRRLLFSVEFELMVEIDPVIGTWNTKDRWIWDREKADFVKLYSEADNRSMDLFVDRFIEMGLALRNIPENQLLDASEQLKKELKEFLQS